MTSFDAGRRAVLKQFVAVPSAVALGAMLWPESSSAGPITEMPAIDPRLHFLRRTSFGVRPADWNRIQDIGIAAYLEEQLGRLAAEDPADAAATALYSYAHLGGTEYWRVVYPMTGPLPLRYNPYVGKQVTNTDKKLEGLRDFEGHWDNIRNQMVNNVLYRALHSNRQLYEVMVQFWTNHFNSYDPVFRGEEQVKVIRAHALGNFRDMVVASQKDTSMSRYLNNGDSKEPTPNENYARELMELHTLGEGNGYTQADVVALSHILAGHTWEQNRSSATFGHYKFEPTWHYNTNKTFMGVTIAGNGQYEIDAAFNRIFTHPDNHCAKFIAYKMCRYFVSDNPPDGLVQRAATAFRDWNYDIKTLLRTILLSPEFAAAANDYDQQKLARPMEYGVGALRAFDIHMTEGVPVNLRNYVLDAGNRPFFWPTPDGYPDRAGFWASTSAFVKAWSFVAQESEFDSPNEKYLFNQNGATRASRRVPKVEVAARDLVRQFSDLLLHRPLSQVHEDLVVNYITGNNPQKVMSVPDVQYWSTAIATILLASPYAQFR